MNKAFFEYACNIVDNLTDEQIRIGLEEHDILIIGKEPAPPAAIKALTFPFHEPLRMDE